MCENKTVKVTLTSEPLPKCVSLAKDSHPSLSTTVLDVHCYIVGGQMQKKVSAECILGNCQLDWSIWWLLICVGALLQQFALQLAVLSLI